MNSHDFATFLAGAIGVFVLGSCGYRKHIQRPRLFLWALGLFIVGLLISDVATSLISLGQMNRLRASGSFVFRPRTALDVTPLLGRWFMYASLPVFVLACVGNKRAFAQCSRCGYDLTGNNSGVCPECGSKLTDDHQGV